jgi:hypothetical protein
MASTSLKVEQINAFGQWLSDRPYTRSVNFQDEAGEPVLVVDVPRDAYHDVSRMAYKFGLRPDEKRGPSTYVFRPGSLESAMQGPAGRL